MFYAIIARDKKDSLKKRMEHRPEHLARIKVLQDQGKLMIAGPFPAIDSIDPGLDGYSGSLIVAEFSSIEEAKRWAYDDPFYVSGIYDTLEIKPFRKTLP